MASRDAPSYVPDEADRLADFLRDALDDDLRSVMWYDAGDFEMVYARDDVRDEYTEDEIEDVVEELTMESLSKPIKEGVYTHGELEFVVQCYENGIEMHFLLDRAEGIAVGLEPRAFLDHGTFVGECMNEIGLLDD